MAQYDYNTSASAAKEIRLPKFEKKEEMELPQFAKDVPLRAIVKKHGRNMTLEYEWNIIGGEEIRISVANFRDGENLANVHKLRIEDGVDVASFRIADTTYVIRKTTEDVAKGLMKAGGKLKASILGVIGYFKTTKENIYTVSKMENDSWSLDKRLGVKQFSLEEMKEAEKRKFFDLVMEQLLRVCKQGYALKDFSLFDVIVMKKKIVFWNAAALVKLSASETVDSLIGNLKVMVKSGIAKKGDVVYGIAVSFGIMKKEYFEWAKENNIKAGDEMGILEKIEKKVLG